jgi:hypothetical protein
MRWLRFIFEDEEDRWWNRQYPELNPEARYFAIAPALGVLSLSFSLGWWWRALVGAAVCVPFLGFPTCIAAIYVWSKAAHDNEGDGFRLRAWMWSGWAVAVLALFIWYRLFKPG